MDRSEKDLHMADLVSKAIEMLDNPGGFFIMAEGGKVDWACQPMMRWPRSTIMIDLDQAINVAVEFYKKHPQET
jgi:alkaline phosphatase